MVAVAAAKRLTFSITRRHEMQPDDVQLSRGARRQKIGF